MTTYREVLGDPRFRLLFTTRTLGIVGDSLRITTLAVLIYAGTRSALLSAVAFGIGFLPQLLGSMLLGSLTDRLRPRPLITAGHLLDAAAAALLGLVRMPVAACLLLVGAVAVLTPVFNGASGRLVAQTLHGDAYVLGRSLTQLAASGAQLLGLAGGGVTVALLGPRGALLAAAALHLGNALAIRLRLPDLPPARSAGGGSVLGQSWRGNGALLRRVPVRRLLLAQWLPSAAVTGAESLVIAYAGARGFPPGGYGFLLACLPVGMLAGDLLVGRFAAPATRERLVAPLAALMGLPLLVFALPAPLPLCAAALLAAGFGFAYALGLQRPFLDALPADGRGQAFTLLGSGSMTLQGVGPALFGAAATLTGTGPAMAAAGAAATLTALWITSWHRPTSPPALLEPA
ncbi:MULTISPECIES: MFS transporter [Kitasatospora]|uniref:Putative major facilitator superfamily transporter n=1 Tax=Kitasatospora setae (strain ATCC 33774 / DSM 43861 / JCM 3304 / KCC A-0304 / NBRC 14216 / KM-6054) TaxID=452652 RepID=E4NIU1_KITSK|nr:MULTISPECIES: MFS transporter [Kitasatospora]BAJ32889.1 putative major facilitator superfamily transporter [Kitasatospora setae KM-6054]